MPRKQRYIHKSDFMSERMLLLNTALAGVRVMKIGLLVGIGLFLLSGLVENRWPHLASSCGPLVLKVWFWITVSGALILLAAHHQQMPTWRRAAIGIFGLHIPIAVPWIILAVVIPAWRIGGRGYFLAALFGFGKLFAISMFGGFIVWAGTLLVLGRTRVVSKMECLACGYSLKKLTSKICPECGNEIRDAVDLLGRGDARPIQAKSSAGD